MAVKFEAPGPVGRTATHAHKPSYVTSGVDPGPTPGWKGPVAGHWKGSFFQLVT